MADPERQRERLRDLVENAPKTLSRSYLQRLYSSLLLQQRSVERSKELDALVNSLVLTAFEGESRGLTAAAALQRLSPIPGLSELLNSATLPQLVRGLPVLLVQDLSDSEMGQVVEKIVWAFCNEHGHPEIQKQILPLVSKLLSASACPPLENTEKSFELLVQWLSCVPTKTSPHRRSLSDAAPHDLSATVLNHASAVGPEQFRSLQAFSALRSWLSADREASDDEGKSAPLSEETILNIREYCLRVTEQMDLRPQLSNTAEFQKACVVEAVELLSAVCRRDPALVHSVFPVVRRLYEQAARAQEVAVVASAMRFFMSHGSSVMHKPDPLYAFVFCELLSEGYRDNFVSFEIVQLARDHLARLCYHSSLLEKTFPTFLKVLAWRPTTFLSDFLKLLPAFMSPQTSLEVLHALLDLPCLTAVLLLRNSEAEPRHARVLEGLRSPEMAAVLRFLTRSKSGGEDDLCDGMDVLYRLLGPLASHFKVVACADAVIPLLRCYFSTFLRYADTSACVPLLPALLHRLRFLFPAAGGYRERVQAEISAALLRLFRLHPELVFHCHRTLIEHVGHLRNFDGAPQAFVHLVWAVGEYVSPAYSSALCRPEVIIPYFESLECTLYEALLQDSSDDLFLKFLSVSASTLAKLAARSQDRIPRAVLCLGKTHAQLAAFLRHKEHRPAWGAAARRILELLSVLHSPNDAAIVLSPTREVESGRLHRDPTSLPFVLRTVTRVLA